jgi:anti-sigma regulatory factor (Ser/Thr protein kinase)
MYAFSISEPVPITDYNSEKRYHYPDILTELESLTLVANELVTNAAKYAFADRDTGEIVLGG